MAVLVGKKAPEFTADAAIGQTTKKISLSDFKGKKYVILYFYPLDFTFVCPTEIHAFQEALKEFESRDAVVLGCSVDSAHSHMAWLRTPKNDGGIRSEEHTSELQSRENLVCRLLPPLCSTLFPYTTLFRSRARSM